MILYLINVLGAFHPTVDCNYEHSAHLKRDVNAFLHINFFLVSGLQPHFLFLP